MEDIDLLLFAKDWGLRIVILSLQHADSEVVVCSYGKGQSMFLIREDQHFWQLRDDKRVWDGFNVLDIRVIERPPQNAHWNDSADRSYELRMNEISGPVLEFSEPYPLTRSHKAIERTNNNLKAKRNTLHFDDDEDTVTDDEQPIGQEPEIIKCRDFAREELHPFTGLHQASER